MKRPGLVGTIALVSAIAVATACVEYKQSSPASPTEVAKVLTSGSWSSATAASASSFSPSTCGNFEWSIASLTTTSASGTFKAVCGGGMVLQGNAEGVLNGLTATITANGTATSTGVSCPFTLNATAVPQSTTAVKVTYTGTVCGVAVSGSEVLTKK
ncbi:MAG: hypothetical protein NTY02_02530 [Acidobacteria bacterium]|nr:hypothetical protein [Acidobacteriota bacterium]